MIAKREISGKEKKKLISNINIPNLSTSTILNSIQFIAEDQERVKGLLYNQKYEACFFKYENKYLPTIHLLRENPSINFPAVQVDQGAVMHILNGADIFTQGITLIDHEFEINSIVVVINPQRAIICLGKSVKSSKDLLNTKGKGIINIHYLGDNYWNGNL